MTERGVTDIMSQSNGLNQIFIEFQSTPDGPGYLGDKLHVEHSVCDVVILDQIKHLCFVDISGIGQGVQDPIRVK